MAIRLAIFGRDVSRWALGPVGLVSAAALIVGPSIGSAGAATGGPDASGYTYVDSTETGGPAGGPFASIAGTGSDIGNHCDDCTSTVALPFPVSFYGVSDATEVVVSSNGNVQFTTDSDAAGDQGVPDPRFGVAALPLQSDLRTDTDGSAIFTQTVGEAPNRQLVIEWDATQHDSDDQDADFQVVFTEGSATVEFRYLAVSPGAGYAVGIQGSGSDPADSLDYTPQGVSDGLAVDFTREEHNTATTLAQASPASSVYGQAVRLSATVTRTDGGDVAPTGSVTFADEDGTLGVAPVSNRGMVAVVTRAISVGRHIVRATYSGDANSTPSSDSLAYTVGRASSTTTISPPDGSTITYGDPVKAVVRTVVSGGGMPTGQVHFSTQSGSADVSLVRGVATAPAGLTPSGSTGPVTATYLGGPNGNYNASSDTATITVAGSSTTTTVKASPTSAAAGKTVTLTATVKAASRGQAGLDDGRVTFYDGGTELATVSPLSNGTARYRTASLAPGTHSITAGYDTDDPAFRPSTSDPVTVTIASGPAVTAISPDRGTTRGGTSVTITGSGFTGATTVLFGTSRAQFTVDSDSQVTAIAPAHSRAVVDIRVTVAGGTSPIVDGDQYAYVNVTGS